MDRSRIAAILASVGLTMSGPMTADAMAMARAVSSGDSSALKSFAREYPQSPYARAAAQLGNQNGKGANGNNGNGVGGYGPGNMGNSKPVGNAKGSKYGG